MSLEDPSLKVCVPIFSFPSLHPFPRFLISNIVFVMLQTLLSRVTLLVKAPNLGSFSMNLFRFSLPFEDFLQKGVNVPEQDVLYN